MANEVQVGTSEVRKIGESTYVRVPLDVVRMHNIKVGLKASFWRAAEGGETIIRIADEVTGVETTH